MGEKVGGGSANEEYGLWLPADVGAVGPEVVLTPGNRAVSEDDGWSYL